MLLIETPASIYTLDQLCTISLGKYILEINVFEGLIDEVQVEKILGKLEDLTEGREYLILINCAPSARLTFKAIQKLATDRAFKYAVAKAYVISTPLQKFSSLFFGLISLFRSRPVKFFTDKSKATQWLKEVVVY